MTSSTEGGWGRVAPFILFICFYDWQLATLFTNEAPHTWEEPLASLHCVVAHTEVSAGVNHRLLIHKTHIVFHLFAQTKDVVALCDYGGHVAETKSQEGRLWQDEHSSNIQKKTSSKKQRLEDEALMLTLRVQSLCNHGNHAREVGESARARDPSSSLDLPWRIHGAGAQSSSIKTNEDSLTTRVGL